MFLAYQSKSALTYNFFDNFEVFVLTVDQKSPWAKLGKNSQKLGTAESARITAGFNTPAFWNGIIVDEFLMQSIPL
jgi:hypothetical protein